MVDQVEDTAPLNQKAGTFEKSEPLFICIGDSLISIYFTKDGSLNMEELSRTCFPSNGWQLFRYDRETSIVALMMVIINAILPKVNFTLIYITSFNLNVEIEDVHGMQRSFPKPQSASNHDSYLMQLVLLILAQIPPYESGNPPHPYRALMCNVPQAHGTLSH